MLVETQQIAQIDRPASAKSPGFVVSPSADLLRQLDDDPRWAAHVAKPVDVLVVHKLAYELAAMRPQLCEGLLDVVDGEQDVADARGIGRDRRGIWARCGGGGLWPGRRCCPCPPGPPV